MSNKIINFQFYIRLVGGLAAPLLTLLTDYKEDYIFLISLVIIYLSLASIVRFGTERFKFRESIHNSMLYLDVVILSLAIGVRGGIRSDFYLGYYFILCYVVLISQKYLLIKISIWIGLCYFYIIIVFNQSPTPHLSRLFIRLVMMIGTAFLLQLLANELMVMSNKYNSALNMALSDPLTGAYNRHMLKELTPTINSNLKNIHVVLIDLDDFKTINDTYGHNSGDEVLKTLIETIKYNLGGQHYCFRYGGEEFLLIVENLSTKKTLQLIHHIRKDFYSIRYPWYHLKTPPTFTVGICPPNEEKPVTSDFQSENITGSLDRMIHKADIALYDGKNSGKNKTVIASYGVMEKVR